MKPRMFIGSSTDGLRIAEAVKAELERTTEVDVTIWSEGVFGPGEYVLAKLLDIADDFDFGLMVMSGADQITSKGATSPIARDNVLIELGLFLSALGQLRTLFLYDETRPPKIATDLSGVIPITFKSREDTELTTALAPACSTLKERIEKLGRRERPGEARVITSPNVLCAGTSEYWDHGFWSDAEAIQNRYGKEAVAVLDRVDAPTLMDALTDGSYDVVHLVAFFDLTTGKIRLEEGKTVSPEHFVSWLEDGGVELVVFASCNSMGLVNRVAPVSNMIGATDIVDPEVFVTWARHFYKKLARGEKLSEAAEAARRVADAPIRLILKEDIVLPAAPGLPSAS